MHLSVTPDTTLRSGALSATLAPAAGGRITSLSAGTVAGAALAGACRASRRKAAGVVPTMRPKARANET